MLKYHYHWDCSSNNFDLVGLYKILRAMDYISITIIGHLHNGVRHRIHFGLNDITVMEMTPFGKLYKVLLHLTDVSFAFNRHFMYNKSFPLSIKAFYWINVLE